LIVLLTLGGIGIWWVVDIVLLVAGLLNPPTGFLLLEIASPSHTLKKYLFFLSNSFDYVHI